MLSQCPALCARKPAPGKEQLWEGVSVPCLGEWGIQWLLLGPQLNGLGVTPKQDRGMSPPKRQRGDGVGFQEAATVALGPSVFLLLHGTQLLPPRVLLATVKYRNTISLDMGIAVEESRTGSPVLTLSFLPGP